MELEGAVNNLRVLKGSSVDGILKRAEAFLNKQGKAVVATVSEALMADASQSLARVANGFPDLEGSFGGEQVRKARAKFRCGIARGRICRADDGHQLPFQCARRVQRFA